MTSAADKRLVLASGGSATSAEPLQEFAEDILEDAPCGFISTLADGTITHANATFVAWTGYSRATLLAGKRFQDLLTVPGRIFFETHFAPLLRMQGFVKEIACQIKCEGREPLPVLVNSSLKLDAGGQPLAIRTIIFDATDRTKYEQDLRRARDEARQLAAIVSSSGEAICSLGLDLVVLTWNPGATQLFGYAEAEAVGRTINDLIVPKHRRAERAQLYETVRSGQRAVVKETMRRHKDGSLLPVELSVAPICDDEGRVTAISVVLRDITERQRTERALRHSEQLHRIAFDLAPTGMVYVAPDERFTRVNARMCEISGYAAHELLEMKVSDLTHPDDLQRDTELLDAFLCGGTPHYENEKRYVRKDGTIHWVAVTARMVTDDAGQPLHSICVIRDIQDRKMAEFALRESEARSRRDADEIASIYATAPIGLCVLDKDLRYQRVNSRLAEINGIPAEAHIGKTVREIVPDVADECERIAAQVFATGEPVVSEVFGMTQAKPGKQRHWTVQWVPVIDASGVVTGINVVADEITERKDAEFKLRASEQRHRTMIEATSAITWHCPPSGLHVEPQPAWMAFTGQSATEMLGMGWTGVLHPEDAEKAGARWTDAVARNVPYHNEVRVRRHDGEWRWMRVHSVSISEGGAIDEWFGMCVDITERKQAEAALRDSEAKLRLGLLVAGTGLGAMDYRNGTVVLDATAAALFALPANQPIPRSEVHARFHADDAPFIFARMAEALQPTGDGIMAIEHRIVRPDHSVIWVSARKQIEYALAPDGSPCPVSGLLAVFNITERKQAEIALRESAGLLRAATDNASVGLVSLDPERRYKFANPAYSKILGLPADIIGKGPAELLPSVYAEQIAPNLDRAFAGQRVAYELVRPAPGQDVQFNHYSVVYEPERGGDGNITGVVVVIFDITARKQAETVLRESAQRMSLAAETTGFGIWEWNVNTNRIRWDARMFQIYGVPLTDDGFVTYETWRSAVLPEDVAQNEDVLKDTVTLHGRSAREFRILRADNGECRTIQAVETMRGNPGGKSEWVVGTNVDITDRKLAEAALRESETLFRATFENAAVGLAHVGPDGGWKRVNERLCQITGYTAGELLSGRFQDITHPDDIVGDLENVQRLLRGESDSYAMEKRYVRKDGAVVWVDLTVGCVRTSEGAIDYFISAVEDISERKTAEAHRALLMAEVNHRAKNVLAVVQAVARQTARSGDTATFEARLSNRIAGLTASHDLLVKNQWQGVEMSDLVRGQLAHFMGLIGTRVLVDGPSVQVSAGAAQAIGMALHELATNAGKYGALSNDDGCVRISWGITVASEPVLTMRWQEEKGPLVVPPSRTGFGQTVMVRMVEHAFDGTVDLAYLRNGLCWQLTAPFRRIQEGARHAQ
jgi:PAS domain S-box-containing protein